MTTSNSPEVPDDHPADGESRGAETASEPSEHRSVRELDDETVARIAAGEVITRPASVVTELVENALDAGATSVTVTVEDAGRSLIRVADDGHGMTRTDARRAVRRHTTSKLDGDIESVGTLGFRGEALASVAAAADLTLVTKPEGGEATRVEVGEGPDGPVETAPAGHRVGTTVSVRDLFADWPARRESLASDRREFARVSDVVTGYALVRPEVRFRLDHGDRTVLSTPGSGDYADAMLGVYDRTAAGRSAVVDHAREDGDVAVRGLAVHPSVTRSNREHVYVAVNGRILRETDLRSAVVEGYGTLLPGDRYPVAVVDVAVPPERVDVNVHPAKETVAFRDGNAVAAAVETAVHEALSGEDLTRTGELSFDLDATLDPEATASAFADVSVIGTFRDLYLLCEHDDDLLVVDQHAAHERINYERLRATVDGGVDSVPVDPAETVSLSPQGSALVEEYRSVIDGLGFEVESFGGTTYRVSAVPAPFGRAAAPDTLRDVVDDLADGRPDDPRETLLADLACHPSLKAGDDLDRETAQSLVDRLGQCEQPYACPHGRPTILSIDETTLAKGFERSGTRMD